MRYTPSSDSTWVAVTAEQRPAIVVPRAIGEAEVALDETRARHRIDRIIGVGVVEARRDPPAVVEAMTQAVGADPLRASLRAGVAAPFQLALPFGTRRGPPAGQAHRLAVDLPGAGVELAVAQREAGPGFLPGFEELAFVEHVDLVGQPPALAQRPAILRVGAEQRVVLAAVGRLGERTIEAVLRGQPVLGIDLRGRAAITITDLGADGRQVGEGPGAAGHHRIVVGVAAMVVVHGQLAATVHIQRRADAVGVACCSQHAGHVATTAAVFLHPAQLGRQAIVLADPPFGSGLVRTG
ncbi:hypothetical protein G6F59_013560 [Rhizopus arrhizus]|nr:hypothetical protein G6F59_013560 [Rhizopus arrhizus]